MRPDLSGNLSFSRLMILIGSTLLLAILIFVGAVLPVEFGRDPLSIGRLTGLDKLRDHPEEIAFEGDSGSAVAHTYDSPFRTDVIEIPLGYPGGGVGPYSLEYKVAMRTGDALLYEWEVIGLAEDERLEFDFHGHTLPDKRDTPIVVATYQKGAAIKQRGSLVAPFAGIHGWYFANRSPKPVTVRLKVSGAYELIAPGQDGNELGLVPTQP
jgi:hypothetical protein